MAIVEQHTNIPATASQQQIAERSAMSVFDIASEKETNNKRRNPETKQIAIICITK